MDAGAAGRARTALHVAAVWSLHFLLVLYFVPRTALHSGTPVVNGAFALEVYRTARARLALDRSGSLFTYDPQVLAGQLAGLTERLGSRTFVLGTAWLAKLGIAPVPAFQAIVLGLHLVFPLVGYVAARVHGLSRRAALVVVVSWSALWFFDALFHAAWFSGRISWLLSSAVLALTLSLLSRFASGGGGAFAALAAAASVVGAFLHPVPASFGALVAALALVARRDLLPRRRLVALSAAVVPLLVAALPLGARPWALSSEPEARLFDVSPAQAFWDLLEVPTPGFFAPGPARTLVRTVMLVAGVLGLSRPNARADARASLFGWAVLGGLVAAYAGDLVPARWPADPYLFLVPATLVATIPGGALLAEIPWAELVRRGPTAARAGLVLLACLVVPRGYRTVATYVPELLPKRVQHPPSELNLSALVGLNEPMPDPLKHEPPPPNAADLALWLTESAGDGRVLVDDAALAGFLSVRAPVALLGPLAERGAPSSDADPSRLLPRETPSAELEAFLRRYAVSLTVASGATVSLDADVPFLGPEEKVFGYRVRRVRAPTGLVAEGAAKVASARIASILVRDASGPRVVLRFHYDPLLACRPGCRVERAPVTGDRAGFVSVPEPPGAFELFMRP